MSYFNSLFLIFLFFSFFACSESDDTDKVSNLEDIPGLATTLTDTYPVIVTTDIINTLESKNAISIVGVVNHQENASSVNLTLPYATTILFGNPQLGTPIMQENILAGLDLPQKLKTALEAAEPVSIIAELDHQANAASVGMDLRPARIIIFGNPHLGTKFMQDKITAAIDLPVKMLIYENDGGEASVAWNDALYLAERHGIDMNLEAIGQVNTALQNFADVATK